MGIDLSGEWEAAVATAGGDGGEERRREVKEESRGGAKVRLQCNDIHN